MIDSTFRLNNIPPLWVSFVGRDPERAQIRDFLEHSRNPIMLVHGQRGVGKSSLVCCVANELSKNFSSVVWLDRSNALELFEKLSNTNLNFPAAENVDSSDLTEIGQKIFVKLRRKNEEINSEIVNIAHKALVDLPGKDSNHPFLLIIDDFDEEYSLDRTKSSEATLCDYIEQFVQYPNRLIITSRLRENCFSGLGYETIEVGLLQEQDVDTLVKRYLGKLDSAVLVNDKLEDTSSYIWNISGGLAEFISRNIIPITTQQEFLLGRDPESMKVIQEFAQCYLFEREQPLRLGAYRVRLEPDALGIQLHSLFAQDSFTEFILWKWLNLNLNNGYSENDLGMVLGVNMLDDAMAAKLHNALRELYKNRFVARQLYESDEVKSNQIKTVTKWILLPLISAYLREYWPEDRQYWSTEAVYLRGFVDAHIDQPEKIEAHYKRIFDVIAWCYTNQDLNNLVLLGISVSKAAGKLIETNSLPSNSTTYDVLVDICRKTSDVLEQQKDTESWRPLIYVLLVLAKLYSSAKADNNQLLFKKAREYAIKALTLSQENQSSEELDATVLTAKLHIYVGELDQAEILLEKVYSSKKQIGVDWAVTAYLLATILRREGNSLKAYGWYEKIVASISQHYKVDIALQSAVDTSRYCSNLNLKTRTMSLMF